MLMVCQHCNNVYYYYDYLSHIQICNNITLYSDMETENDMDNENENNTNNVYLYSSYNGLNNYGNYNNVSNRNLYNSTLNRGFNTNTSINTSTSTSIDNLANYLHSITLKTGLDKVELCNYSIKEECIEPTDCPICLCSYPKKTLFYVMKCSHSFCINCCENWFSNNFICPLCRTNYNNNININ